jgi:hypothetical protein
MIINYSGKMSDLTGDIVFQAGDARFQQLDMSLDQGKAFVRIHHTNN